MSSSVIILVIGVAALALLAIWLFRPAKEQKTIVQLDKNQSVKINSTENGSVKIEILYDTWEDRPSDGELFPDIFNEAVTPPEYGHDLWDMVTHFDTLDAEKKEFVASVLAEKGFIRKDDVAEFAMGALDDGPDPDSEEPVNRNPAEEHYNTSDNDPDNDPDNNPDNDPEAIPDL